MKAARLLGEIIQHKSVGLCKSSDMTNQAQADILFHFCLFKET